MMLLRITLPYACFGAILDGSDLCIRVAPIGRWMIGRRLADIAQWVRGKGGRVERVL